MYRKCAVDAGPVTEKDKVSAPSLVWRFTSDTLFAALEAKDLGIAPRSSGVFAVTGTSTAINLMPSELLPPTAWVASPVLASRVVKSLKGIGSRTENAPLVETAACHPEPSSVLTPIRCISSFGCCAFAVAHAKTRIADEKAIANRRKIEATMADAPVWAIQRECRLFVETGAEPALPVDDVTRRELPCGNFCSMASWCRADNHSQRNDAPAHSCHNLS